MSFDLCRRAEIIQVGLNMHLYDDIGDASSSLRGSTSSYFIHFILLWGNCFSQFIIYGFSIFFNRKGYEHWNLCSFGLCVRQLFESFKYNYQSFSWMHIFFFYVGLLWKGSCKWVHRATCSVYPLPCTTLLFWSTHRINTFTLADGYSRHVEFAQNAQPQFSTLYWKELSNILWMCIYVFKKYICTIKSIDAYRRHVAFGP